jgi:DNA mismatch repair protein MutS
MSTKKEETIYDEYFRLTQQYVQEYGPRTILLLQVGKFFEMYGLITEKGSEIQGSIVKEVCEICDLKMSNPAIGITTQPNTQTRIMAGFQICYLEKYLQILTEAGITSVVYVEDKSGAEGANTKKKINRVLYNIYSSGTYIPTEETSDPKLTNNIVCIWFEKYTPLKNKTIKSISKTFTQMLMVGISAINVYSGKANIFEYETEYLKNPTTYDELERFISMYNPSEVIIISDFSEQELTSIVQYTNIKTNMIHFIEKNVDTSKENATQKRNTKVENCMKQTYINHILSKYYGEECIHICNEFYHYPVATQSFCFLLDFVNMHCPDLVKKIDIPLFNNSSDRVILANHTLKQLNIIDDMTIDAKKCGKLSSVYSFLNKCCTSMGKRRFQTTLLMPVFNEEWLETEYGMTQHMLSPKNAPFIANFRKSMGQIKDMERIARQLIMRKLSPNVMFQLYESICCIQNINVCLYESPELMDYLVPFSKETSGKSGGESGCEYIETLIQQITAFMESQLYVSLCQGETSLEKFNAIIIKRGVSNELDVLVDKYNSQLQFIEDCKLFFNHLMRISEKSPDGDFVKKHETEKGGIVLQMTNKRGQTLKRIIDHSYPQTVTIESGGLSYPITSTTIKMTASTTSMSEITFPKLDIAIKDVYKLKTEINDKMMGLYLNFMVSLENTFGNSIHQLTEYICRLDVLVCKAHIAQEYNYCRPSIDSAAEKSYVNAKELRHVLIEHIQQNELYVTNDVSIGTQCCTGILLYGTNAVGKTSIIRALGISIIMAQAGLFVPATEFIYKPYTAIYSRILGNDNLFKGLSTFAVEMSELRVILNNADNGSLVLGDELCSGTESESALSIFVAGLMELYKRQTTFLFATHFHEITNYDEIRELKGLKCMHLSVYYDKENDCLVYDRKLKEGSGTRMYGLEVCKSLYLPTDFLEKAYELRAKYHPAVQGDLSYKASSYNAKKIRGLCEMCKEEMAEETHHLQEQQYADEKGFIGSFHKNHSANLLCVCSKCHDKIHYGNGNVHKSVLDNKITKTDNKTDNETKQTEKVPNKMIKKKTTKGMLLL